MQLTAQSVKKSTIASGLFSSMLALVLFGHDVAMANHSDIPESNHQHTDELSFAQSNHKHETVTVLSSTRGDETCHDPDCTMAFDCGTARVVSPISQSHQIEAVDGVVGRSVDVTAGPLTGITDGTTLRASPGRSLLLSIQTLII